MFYVYIIYSKIIDKYYVGVTTNVIQRVEAHNSKLFDKAYTKITDDWVLYLSISCNSKRQALLIERHIKNMKSRTYIENLKRHAEISMKLIEKYS